MSEIFTAAGFERVPDLKAETWERCHNGNRYVVQAAQVPGLYQLWLLRPRQHVVNRGLPLLLNSTPESLIKFADHHQTENP